MTKKLPVAHKTGAQQNPKTTAWAPATNEERERANRKAKAVEKIARALLRTDQEKLVEEQAVDFLNMPDEMVYTALQRLDAVSPDALPQASKTKRALACVKLAARLLQAEEDDGVPDEEIERLSCTLMSVDDPTLRSMLRQVSESSANAKLRHEKKDFWSKIAF